MQTFLGKRSVVRGIGKQRISTVLGNLNEKIMAIPSPIGSSIQGEGWFYFFLKSDLDCQRYTRS